MDLPTLAQRWLAPLTHRPGQPLGLLDRPGDPHAQAIARARALRGADMPEKSGISLHSSQVLCCQPAPSISLNSLRSLS